MAGEMWCLKLLAVIVGLLVMVPETTQLNVDHPLHSFVERLNLDAGPFLGLVISNSKDEKILYNSTYYEASTSTPYITIAGRRFNFGKFNGVPVVVVISGAPLANVGVTVQILLDTFRIKGIIAFGSAGTISNKVFITDVVVPSQVAYTSVWNWKINFGERPTVHIGEVKIGSSDIYVSNAAYASHLNKQLDITAVDTASAAVVSTAIANGVPHIIFRGTSNRPGTSSDSRLSQVTTKNVIKVVAKFVDAIAPSVSANVY